MREESEEDVNDKKCEGNYGESKGKGETGKVEKVRGGVEGNIGGSGKV